MNLFAFLPILSVMMIVHELGHFITARLAGITVQEFGIGLPPRLWGFRYGGVLYSINLIPFGAFVKMLGEEDPSAPGSFASKSRAVRALVLSAGSGMNFLLAVAAFAVAFMIGLPTVAPDGPVKLAGIAAESPAEQAGLRKGDEVVTFNGQPVNVGQFRELTQQHLGQSVELGVRRGEAELSVTLTPRPNPPKGQGTVGVVLDANGGMVRASPLRALQLGVDQTVRAVGMTFLVPKLVLDGAIAPSDARPIGLPGMAKLTADAVDDAVATQLWFPVFMLTGMFSAGLSVANMLPIPALDGGRLLFVVIEWVRRGRRVPPEREAAYHFVGIVLLLTLMVIISVNDIVSPVPRIDWGIR
jgi:regulator of sigma E protease